ncbi:hypothetical protein MMC24_006149 [Lignoscripta atroalba]|nr:hypothetical protein [Lignoscripta atroalba]
MQIRTQSLLDYLRIPNPAVSGEACPDGSNTKSTKNDYYVPRAVCEWEEFEYETLNVFYGGELRRVLEQEFDLQDFSGIPDFPFCKYFDENSFESLLIKWNHSIVSEALSKAQHFLSRMHDPIYMVRGGQAESPYPRKKWKPDWGCVRLPRFEPRVKRKNLLPGDTKVSAKWSSELIKTGEMTNNRESKDWTRPISQIYSYCVRNNTRYGYIITDAELVAVRIRLVQQHDPQTSFDTARSSPEPAKSVIHRARTEGILEYKAIPWTEGGNEAGRNSKSMTINLALWWLHLIATGKTDIGDDYGTLRDTLWEQDAKDQKQGSEDQVEAAQNRVPDPDDQVPDIESMGLDQVSV